MKPKGTLEDYVCGREAFDQLVREGVDSNVLIACSSAYSEKVRRTGETPMPITVWLTSGAWREHLH